MLKATDLMIGDWVLDSRSKTPSRVNPFLAAMVIPEWEPIPLSKDLLIANGFEEIGDNEFQCGDIELQARKRPKGTFEVCIASEDGFYQVIVAYVHELQHFLKLSKNPKSIEV